MKKPVNILSIDWDYFINATEKQRIMDFPDPNDNLGQELNKIVWSSRYASNPSLTDIGVTVSEFDELKNYLNDVCSSRKSESIETMITNSHKFIYDFVFEKIYGIPECDRVPIRMFHIDYHTDYYGMTDMDDKKKELNCGNWLNYLCEYLKGRPLKFSNVMWLAREDSEPSPDMPKIMNRVTYDATMDDLGDMINSYFNGKIPDMIFICKSNPWSPPHLDDRFDELFDIAKGIGRVRYSSDIINRYTDEFNKTIDDLRKLVKENTNELQNR